MSTQASHAVSTPDGGPERTDDRIPILYLAPWVDIGGSDKGTIDWFRHLDRDHFSPSLITTQPSPNRRLSEVEPYAEELWELPQLLHGDEFPRFILSFIHTRGVRVVHIMNSRIGFELLPDMMRLPQRPRIVVQMHAEEPNQSGYVRYVTTRYGNLVDAFSVSNKALSERLARYDIPASKRRLIRTGVDAEGEFSPERVPPIEGLDGRAFQILYPARLTAQKDPLLMLDVAARLRASGGRFQIHAVGDGELAGVVRERVIAEGLQDLVVMHGASVEIAAWYAGCDAVLLTSEFEGLPYVAYEAMAMELPLVAPDLPGLDELITADTGFLVRPRDEPGRYVDALHTLAKDGVARKARGKAARARVLSDYSLERMAAEHAALYRELIRDLPPRRPLRGATSHTCWQAREVITFSDRRPGATPLVSVIVTCFNHGRHLPACLGSIQRQTYDAIETFVVDDGSTEPETLAALAMVEREGSATVVRLPDNHGPSVARNAGVARAHGRYMLPLDADDLLFECAVAELVDQLNGAGERIGFIYPNLQFFGNRSDYQEMSSYNLHALMSANQCPVCSLLDREVFDRGLRYPEDLVLGHEDWDFALTLAEHGVYGEPARGKTVLCRKYGFTRNDLVESGPSFAELLADRHPRLFSARPEIKADWNPALTLVGLDPLPDDAGETLSRLARDVSRQTCSDFELLMRIDRGPQAGAFGCRMRALPVAGSRAETVARALERARGRWVLATYGCLEELLADPASIEKVLRVMSASGGPSGLAFADAGSELRSFEMLDSDGANRARLHALCWNAIGPLAAPAELALGGERPLEAVARWLGAHRVVQWRNLRAAPPQALAVGEAGAQLGAPRLRRAGDARFRDHPPALPQYPAEVTRRLEGERWWRPPQTQVLYRHLHHGSGRYLYTNEQSSPDGCTLDHALGCLRRFHLAGTDPLLVPGDEPTFASGEPPSLGDPSLLGFFEKIPLPLLDALQVGRHPGTGQLILAAGSHDPLAGVIEDARTMGFLEPYPLNPRFALNIDANYGLVGLVRSVDPAARRHRYGAGAIPQGLPAGELGALYAEPTGDCEPFWLDTGGRVFMTTGPQPRKRPSLSAALRWTGAPLTWTNFGRSGPKLRASVRRAYDSARILATGRSAPGRPLEPVGYVLRSAIEPAVPLYAALHPVTGDQLLSSDLTEAGRLGYQSPTLLGYLVARAPVTGALGPLRPPAPWASRFGLPGR